MHRLRRIGKILVLLAFAVVGVSAWLRLAGAGLGCADWPACYAAFLDGMPYALPPGGRMVHRLVATSALLLACYACWLALKPHPLAGVVPAVMALTVLMLLLSLVGIWSNDPRRVFVNFLNLLGGPALVVMSWRVVWATTDSASSLDGQAARTLWMRAGMLFLTATVLLGALIGARYAAVTCATLPVCATGAWPNDWSGLDPLVMLSGVPPIGETTGSTLHLLHRYAALATLVLLGVGAGKVLGSSGASSAAKRGAQWVMLLLIIEALLGMMTLATGFSLAVVIAHNLAAAALLAAAVRLRQVV